MLRQPSSALGSALPIFVIKNTFIDVPEEPLPARRRSSSVPPRAAARGTDTDASDEEAAAAAPRRRGCREAWPPSDASTDCSDGGDAEDVQPPPPVEPPPPPVRISLHDVLEGSGAGTARTPLRRTPLRANLSTKASLFQPKLAVPPDSIAEVVNAVREAVGQSPVVCRAQLLQGPMGGVTTIVAEVSKNAAVAQQDLLELAKNVLRDAAEQSPSAYLMGFNSLQPFKAFGSTGFSASVAYLPLDQHHLACWDLIRGGVCPRRGCRWCHTRSCDQIQLVVTVKLV